MAYKNTAYTNTRRSRPNALRRNLSDSFSDTAGTKKMPQGNTFEHVFAMRKQARGQAKSLNNRQLKKRTARLTRRFAKVKAANDLGQGSALRYSNVRARLSAYRNQLSHELGVNVKGKGAANRSAALKKRLGGKYSRYYGYGTSSYKGKQRG